MNKYRSPSVLSTMTARLIVLCGAILGAALGASPADAARRCGNALADGSFIVQGPLVDEFGDFCSLAVVPRSPGNFSRLTVIDGAQFSGETLILSPPFVQRPRRVMVVESPQGERSREFNSRRFASPTEPQQLSVPFTTGTIGPFTTGTIGPFTTGTIGPFTTGTVGPFTTFSNSPPGNSPPGRVGHH